MASIIHFATISAILYLARFVLARQHQIEDKYLELDSEYFHKNYPKGNLSPLSDFEGLDEKVLIRSGVPLRGRTIHQTAWSEEEKVLAHSEDPQADAEEEKESVDDGWCLTKALRYVLSFVYELEDENKSDSLHTLKGKTNYDTSKLHKTELNTDKAKTIDTPSRNKEKPGNIPKHKEIEDSSSKTASNYLNKYFPNQDVELGEEGISNLDDDESYADSHNEGNELLDECTSTEYEDDEMNNEDHEDQLFYINSKIKDPKVESENGSMESEPNLKENEVENDTTIPSKSMKSELETHRKDEDDHFPPTEKKKQVNVPNTKVYEPENDTKISDNTHHNLKQQSNKFPNQKNIIRPENNTLNTSERTQNSQLKDINNGNKVIPKSVTPKLGSSDDHKNLQTHKTKPTANGEISGHKYKKNVSLYGADGGKKDLEGNGGGVSTEKSSADEKIIEYIPSTENSLNQQRQFHHKEPSSESDPYIQNGKTKIIEKDYQIKKRKTIPQVATTASFNERQLKKVTKPHDGTKTTVIFTVHAHKPEVKIITDKNVNNTFLSPRQSKQLETHSKQSEFSNFGSLKKPPETVAKQVKPKHKYQDDIFLDLELDEGINSYNYLLDSFEFIRLDERSRKLNKKLDNSIYEIVEGEDHDTVKKDTSFLRVSPTSIKPRSKSEIKDESLETFNTILEYLYKHSNNSFLMSLKEKTISTEIE